MCGSILGACATIVTSAFPNTYPCSFAKLTTWRSKIRLSIFSNSLAVSGKCLPISPIAKEPKIASEIKNVLSELIKSETQTIMLSKSSPEYMFKTIDGALVPEFKLGPKRSIICIVGTILGGFLALLIALIRYFYRQTKLPL